MTTYNTGNPIGSKDPRDLYDNAENLDEAVNTRNAESWDDRFGVPRKTWWGMEREFNADQDDRDARFNTFIASSGYQFLGDYAPGIEITEYNQIIRDSNGEFWRLSGQVELPYTTTGAGLPEDDSLTPLGDAVLRQDLANPNQGAALVARGVLAVDSIADLLALPTEQRREDLRYLVKGYYAGSDVGGGEFYWDANSTETANGGTVFGDSTNGRWVRRVTDPARHFSLANFGYDFLSHSESAEVVADRIFDHIQTLPESTPVDVFFDAGVIFDGQCTLRRGNCRVHGDSRPITVRKNGVGSARFFLVSPDNGRNQNITLENLHFRGDFDSSLEVMYQNRASEYGARLLVSGVENFTARNIRAHRIQIPLDVRNSVGVNVSDLSLTEGNIGFSSVSSQNLTINNIRVQDYDGSVVDFANVIGATVTNIFGKVSEVGRGFSEEFFDMGACQNITVSNAFSLGPTRYFFRMKSEDEEMALLQSIHISNAHCRDIDSSAFVFQSIASNPYSNNFSFSNVSVINGSGNAFTFTGSAPVWGVNINGFLIDVNSASAITLPGVSDLRVSNGTIYTGQDSTSNSSITVGFRSAFSIPASNVHLDSLEIIPSSTTPGVPAIRVTRCDGFSMKGVKIRESRNDGVILTDCKNVDIVSCEFHKIGRNGVNASFSTDEYASGENANFRVSSCAFYDIGFNSSNRASVFFNPDGVVINAVAIKNNFTAISASAPTHNRFGVLIGNANGGMVERSVIAENDFLGVDSLVAGGGVGATVLQRNNDDLQG